MEMTNPSACVGQSQRSLQMTVGVSRWAVWRRLWVAHYWKSWCMVVRRVVRGVGRGYWQGGAGQWLKDKLIAWQWAWLTINHRNHMQKECSHPTDGKKSRAFCNANIWSVFTIPSILSTKYQWKWWVLQNIKCNNMRHALDQVPCDRPWAALRSSGPHYCAPTMPYCRPQTSQLWPWQRGRMVHWSFETQYSGTCSNIKTVFSGIGIPIIKIRRLWPSYLYNLNSYTGTTYFETVLSVTLAKL